ncbi:MAG: hypothetical protein PF488_03695 [Patescibacteria group bacterium]|jgi:cell division septal protein FtsQ|nr:hypothetical protein [Patescibacteria group bacterium]
MVRRRNKRKKIKKDYQDKKLSNPFFRKKKKPEKSKKGIRLKVIMSIVFLIAIIYTLFCLPLLNIKTIKVEGLSRLPEEEIISIIKEDFDDKKLFVLSQKNILLFNKDKHIDKILNKHNFAKVKINKKLFNTLEVVISEKPYAFVYGENDNFFYSSKDYFLINEINFETESEEDINKRLKYFTIINQSEDTFIKNNDKLDVEEEYIRFITNLNREVENYGDEFDISHYIIPDVYFKTAILKIIDGPEIKFDVKSDLSKQLDQLILVKREKMKDNFNNLEYIDLRYGNKIYFYPENIINN